MENPKTGDGENLGNIERAKEGERE